MASKIHDIGKIGWRDQELFGKGFIEKSTKKIIIYVVKRVLSEKKEISSRRFKWILLIVIPSLGEQWWLSKEGLLQKSFGIRRRVLRRVEGW